MSLPAPETLRRGWCPGALRPMETGDGWLVRVSPPPGRLGPQALRALADLAERHGNGLIEISGRGNLQIRGLTPASHPPLVSALIAEGLVDPDEGEGPQRLTLRSPLAGLDRTDRIDAAALADAIEARCSDLAGLPPKFAIAVDGGGALALDGFAADLRVRAVDAATAVIGLPGGRWFGPLPPDTVAERVAAVVAFFLARRSAAPDRLRRLRDLPAEAMAALAKTLGVPACPAPAARPAPRSVGRFATGRGTQALIAALPFGRCDAASLRAFAQAAETAGVAGIRLSPWRGLAFLGLRADFAVAPVSPGSAKLPAPTSSPHPEEARRAVSKDAPDHSEASVSILRDAADPAPQDEGLKGTWGKLSAPGGAEPLSRALAAAGLILDPADPRLHIQACPGRPACLRGEAPAMADAARLAAALPGLTAGGRTVHVSGCIKSCAHSGASALTLVGRDGGYDVVIAGTARDERVARLDFSALMRRLAPGADLRARLDEALSSMERP